MPATESPNEMMMKTAIASAMSSPTNCRFILTSLNFNLVTTSIACLDHAFAQNQSHRAAETGGIAIISWPQDRRLRQGVLSQLRLDDRAEGMPYAGNISHDHNLFRRERRGDHTDAAAQLKRCLLERADCLFIS